MILQSRPQQYTHAVLLYYFLKAGKAGGSTAENVMRMRNVF